MLPISISGFCWFCDLVFVDFNEWVHGTETSIIKLGKFMKINFYINWGNLENDRDINYP